MASEYSAIKKSTLKGIANAVRTKTNTTADIPTPNMESMILGIKTEPKLTEITVTPARTASFAVPPDGFEGFSKVNVEAAKLQNKVVTPGVKTQAVLPEGDAIGLFQVTVKAAALEEATVTPTTEEQVFTPSGENIGFSKFTVKAAESGVGNLPNAEDMVFGSGGSSSFEYGILLKDDSPLSTGSNNGTMGWAFTVLDDIVVKGLRYYSPGNAVDKSRIVRLWSGDGREVLVEYSAPNDSITDPSGWVEHILETPLTLEAGKTYNLSVYSTVGIATTAVENVTLNPKIQYVRYWFVDNEHMFDFSSSDYKNKITLCDFVAETDDAVENVNRPCIIQTDTVDDIADEANRIVGKSGKISPAQIVSTLKSVTAGGAVEELPNAMEVGF